MDPRTVSLFSSVALAGLMAGLAGHHFYVKNKLMLIEGYLEHIHRENKVLESTIARLEQALKDKKA